MAAVTMCVPTFPRALGARSAASSAGLVQTESLKTSLATKKSLGVTQKMINSQFKDISELKFGHYCIGKKTKQHVQRGLDFHVHKSLS